MLEIWFAKTRWG